MLLQYKGKAVIIH